MRSSVVAIAVVLLGGCQKVNSPPAPSELVRAGARPTAVRQGNLDGDAEEEVVVASVSEAAAETGFPTPYLEVFDLRDGDWRRVFDAGAPAPPGHPGTPPEMLEDEVGFTAQSVQVLELVDFEGDGAAEIVVGIASGGATVGPVELWVLSAAGEHLRTDFYEGTDRGGELTVETDRVRFAFPVYRPGDPGCCPSRLETQTIGHDGASGRITILERERVTL